MSLELVRAKVEHDLENESPFLIDLPDVEILVAGTSWLLELPGVLLVFHPCLLSKSDRAAPVVPSVDYDAALVMAGR